MKKIFVIDDDDLILKSLVRSLNGPGIEVVAFCSGEEALSRLKENPNLLICDYHLPKTSGLSVLSKAKQVNSEIRTLLLSGGVKDERISAALESKTLDQFLTKPWHHDELLSMTRSLLNDPCPAECAVVLEGY